MRDVVAAAKNNTNSFGQFRSFVRPEYRKDYQIPLLPYQTNGILSKVLWPSKDHVIRIIPGYDQQTLEPYPQNINCNEYAEDADPATYLSDTFMRISIASGIGPKYETIITNYAPGSSDIEQYGGNTVFHQFARNILYAIRDDGKKRTKFGVTQTVRRWCGDAKSGTLHFDKSAIMMQALMFKVNGKETTDSDKQPLVDETGSPLPLFGVVAIDHAKSVTELLRALVEPANPAQPLNPHTNSRYGAFAESDGIKLFLNTVRDDKYNKLRPSVQEPGKGWTPTHYPLTPEQIASLWVPWDNLLDYMTAEEQLKFLASRFDACAVNYYVGTDPILRDLKIPEEIAKAGYGEFSCFTDGITEVKQNIVVGGLPNNQPQVYKSQPLGHAPFNLGSTQQFAPRTTEPAAVVQKPSAPQGLAAALSPNTSSVVERLQQMQHSGVKLTRSAEDQINRANALLNAKAKIPEDMEADEEL